MTITDLKNIGFSFGSKGGYMNLKRDDYYESGASLWYRHKNCDINSKEEIELDGFSISNSSSAAACCVEVKLSNIKSIEDIKTLRSFY
jgi:hypothetical protein